MKGCFCMYFASMRNNLGQEKIRSCWNSKLRIGKLVSKRETGTYYNISSAFVFAVVVVVTMSISDIKKVLYKFCSNVLTEMWHKALDKIFDAIEFNYQKQLSISVLIKRCSEICSKFTGEQPCQNSTSSNFTEITFRYGCFPVTWCIFLEQLFLRTLRRTAS